MNDSNLNASLRTRLLYDMYIAETFLSVGLPLPLLLGLPGNTLIIFLMCRRRMRRNPAAKFLLSLGISDLVFDLVAVGGLFIAIVFKVKFPLHSDIFCKAHAFIVAMCIVFSNHMLVCLSATRLYYTVKTVPSGGHTILRKTRILIGIVLLLSILFSLHLTFIYGSAKQTNGSYNCRVVNISKSKTALYHWIRISYVYTLPAVLIGIFNLLTLVKYKKHKSNLHQMRAVLTTHMISPQQQQEKQMTKLLMVASIVFFLLTVPGNIMWWFTRILHSRKFYEWDGRIYAIHMFIDSLLHSVSFYIYCLMARFFRQEFLQMCACKRGTLVHPQGLRSTIRNVRTEPQGDVFTLSTSLHRP